MAPLVVFADAFTAGWLAAAWAEPSRPRRSSAPLAGPHREHAAPGGGALRGAHRQAERARLGADVLQGARREGRGSRCRARRPRRLRISGDSSSRSPTATTKRSKPDGRSRRAAGALRPDLVSVRHAARGEEELAGAQGHGLAGQVQRELATEDVEALVLVAVHVQRGHLAGGHVHVDEAERAAGGEHAGGGAEEVDWAGTG